jgi:hypothetical protein
MPSIVGSLPFFTRSYAVFLQSPSFSAASLIVYGFVRRGVLWSFFLMPSCHDSPLNGPSILVIEPVVDFIKSIL